MSALPLTIRQSELAGRLVILRDSMDEVGHVEVVWMHPPVHRVFGFICASGFLGRKKSAFNLPQLHAIGDDGLLVNSAPVPTDGKKVRQIESLLGYELWTDSGEKVGHVVDYIFDTKTGAIKAYLFTSHPLGALTDGLYQIPPRQMLSYGDRRIRIRDQVLESPELYKPGLKQKIATVGESVLESAEEEWRSLTEQALTLREQALEKWQSLTEQAKNTVVSQAKDKAQSFKERGLGFVDRLREQTQSYTEQLRTDLDGNWNPASSPDEWPFPDVEGRAGEYRWDDRAADDLWDESDDFSDDFEKEFDDWDAPPAGSTRPQSAPTAQVATSEKDDDDEWDTWELDESSDPSPSTPGERPEGDRPDAVPQDEPSSAQATTMDDNGSDISDEVASASVGEQSAVDGAIADPQVQPPIPTEPIPPEDLDDDDPWI